MKPIIAIDPGPQHSGLVILIDGMPDRAGVLPNDQVLTLLRGLRGQGAELCIEMIASYGMPVGRDVFQTCVQIGRFGEAYGGAELIERRAVKLHLCGSARAKDANIRQALIDRYGPGKDAAIGKKSSPGPLYGIKSHAWAALAVGVTHLDLRGGG